eukprot:TRINITY_DN7545_c1_g1_i1.p1 TRINITY_DN7545_c1_g1~~TRINITY_DN7545_c1_g1_i1.p1  ORF type:complete len:301 (+),score=45.61 TRINITY_DN7545_c1_g1_i1:53-904(+)
MSFGQVDAVRFTSKAIAKAHASQVPEMVSWRVRKSAARNPNPNVKPPTDDPWTYKNRQEHSQWSPWKDLTPYPVNDKEEREILRDDRYTSGSARQRMFNENATKTIAGMEMLSRNEEKTTLRDRPRYDLRKPLGMLKKQRAMVADHLAGVSKNGPASSDTFLSPNLFLRTSSDNSRTSANSRVAALREWRMLAPTITQKVPKSRVLSSRSLTSAQREMVENLPVELLSFDEYFAALNPSSTFYKLGTKEVPSGTRLTSTEAFPYGYSHGGVTGYGGGTLATGS